MCSGYSRSPSLTWGREVETSVPITTQSLEVRDCIHALKGIAHLLLSYSTTEGHVANLWQTEYRCHSSALMSGPLSITIN